MMPSSIPPSQTPLPVMAGPKSFKPSLLSDAAVFAAGALLALLLFFSFHSFISPSPPFPEPLPKSTQDPLIPSSFYDDPSLSYTISQQPIKNWDQKRRQWLLLHPQKDENKILMLTGSQPTPCRNPIGDHLLLRFFKNKVDYCRLHGIDIFYNTALLHPQMFSFWAKIPVVRAAMVAHPESEWIWWVDSDAAFTDMDFELPLPTYSSFNLVFHGWPHLVRAGSWTSLNAGVFLIRNCQWSFDLLDRWAKMGPQSSEYKQWGEIQRSVFKDKLFPESDDQTGMAYLLLKEKGKWGDKIYLENRFLFEGYWLEIVGKLDEIEEKYLEMERRVKGLRRRRAEKVGREYGKMREEYLEKEGVKMMRRPFVTHFTGCQPCSGDHNKLYSGENCWEGMQRALNFADNQVLRAYGFRHESLVNSTGVRPLPFDFPAAG